MGTDHTKALADAQKLGDELKQQIRAVNDLASSAAVHKMPSRTVEAERKALMLVDSLVALARAQQSEPRAGYGEFAKLKAEMQASQPAELAAGRAWVAEQFGCEVLGAEPVAIVSSATGGGPNDVCIEWRGGIASVGEPPYRLAPREVQPLTDEQFDLIAADGMRNAAGGIYATSVYEFGRAAIAEFCRINGITQQDTPC